MIRTLVLALLLGTSFSALNVTTAAAQVTDQTDQSEEDWRKSKKKRGTSDIFEDIQNNRSTGQGVNQYPQDPMDSLPDESRRHLMKERAKRMALSEPGQAIDERFEPSEGAKEDPELAEQEKVAWTELMTDLKGGGAQGSGPNEGKDGNGQSGNSVVVTGQGGDAETQSRGQSPSSSTIRGGSSQSVADIMAQIKGLKSGSGTGTGSGSGTGSSSEGSERSGAGSRGPLSGPIPMTSPSPAPVLENQNGDTDRAIELAENTAQMKQMAADEAQAQANAAQAEAQATQTSDRQADANAAHLAAAQMQAQADAAKAYAETLKSQSESGESQSSDAQSDNAADTTQAEATRNSSSQDTNSQDSALQDDAADSQTTPAPETIGPLERAKQSRDARQSTGQRTSASDFLNRGNTPE